MNDDQPAVVVKDLFKSFKLPHEQSSGIKQLIVNFAKRKKGYEVQHVLENVSFEIKKGEFFGIVGRNGSGKSTLLKLLAGIYAPDKGLVQVNGSLTPFIELGVGFNPELTGRENVFLNGALLGFSRSEITAIYDDIVEFAELERFMDQKLKNYSSGMQVRLAFSISVRASSDILLIDEVLAVGDAAFQQKCYDYFNRLRDEKKTIIFVTHDMNAVKRFCSRALYLENGCIKTVGDPSDIADIYFEENIKSMDTLSNKEPVNSQVDSKYTVQSKKIAENDEAITIGITSNQPPNTDTYVALSILKDGVSVAEINSNGYIEVRSKRVNKFEITKGNLNAGSYQISAVLCDRKSARLLALAPRKIAFQVKQLDPTRGGALKLVNTWSVGEQS